MRSSMTTSNGSLLKAIRATLATVIAATAFLALAPSAMAAYSHPYDSKFPVGGTCTQIYDIAVLEPEKLIYVSCQAPNQTDHIRRFNFNGTPAAFSGSAPYIAGNAIIADPESEDGTFGFTPEIAVDSSASPNHGKLFVNNAPNTDIFGFDGKFAGAVIQPTESSISNRLEGIDIGTDGFIYVTSGSPGGRVSKYNPGLQEVKRLYTGREGFFNQVDHVRVDTTGAIWAKFPPEITKYEVDQFTDELKPGFGTPEEAIEPFFADPSPLAPNPLFSGGGTVGRFDVDNSDNDLYVARGNRIETYSAGKADELAYLNSPPFGSPNLNASEAIAVTSDHHVVASTVNTITNAPEVAHFLPGDILPDPHTFAPLVSEVGHTDAIVRGEVELAGGSPIVACKFQYGAGFALEEDCEPNPASAPPGSYFNADTQVSAKLEGLATGSPVNYRLMAENEDGKNFGITRTVTPAHVLQVETLPATEIDRDGGKLNAKLDPDNSATEFKFQYGVTTGYGLETDFEPAGSEKGVITVGQVLSGLPEGTTFNYRVVTKNVGGQTIGQNRTFRTASPPDISGVRTTEVTEDSAVLHAEINPVGFETKYRFAYGTTTNYGQFIPTEFFGIGSGTEPVKVSQKLENLQPGVTYHFVVIAENKWGTSESGDTTFDFAPPACPNNHVRQQTGSAFLPDCRAYELVSPAAAGAAILVPSRLAANKESFQVHNENIPYILNRGFAGSPPRFTYFSAISTLEGLDAPLGPVDMYMATRTNDGWVSAVPGLQGIDAFETGRKECSEALDLCMDHSETTFAGYDQEGAPYVYTADGAFRGRLPTNVDIVEDGRYFQGSQRISGDFNHFVFASSAFSSFSTPNFPGAIFAPGGKTEGLGSAYDNNIKERTVSIISRTKTGNDIPLDGPKGLSDKGFDFPGITPSGSHILMQTPAEGGRVHLWLRVNNITTYNISFSKVTENDAAVEQIGMTRDGGKVYFVTDEKMTVDDEDSSDDLFMWEENGDKVTRISRGDVGTPGAPGNVDSCSSTWGVSGCGVKPLTPEKAHPNLNRAVSVPGQDDQFAEVSGDIFFYSPESLDTQRPGIPNQRNLYVYRQGEVRRVATFDEGTQIQRMQISPDGGKAAMLTSSRLTSSDNAGFDQAYTLDVDSGIIRCASCDPAGSKPTTDVTVSQGGRFMSNDGRTFFSTSDSLVPRDQNGKIIDTYEYVDGRPQLISSGLGATDYTGGSEVLSLFLPPEFIGLEHVSRDGTDVFFSTFETLIDEDHNGEFVKFYDARVGGGFARDPQLAPCAAADECHGPDSSAPTPPVVASDDNLGKGGNVVVEKQKKKKKKKKKKKRKGKRGQNKRSGR